MKTTAPKEFWQCLDNVCSGRTELVTWQQWFGREFIRLEPFLRPTEELASWYPCPHVPPCACSHEVRSDGEGGWFAVCQCEDDDCEAVDLKSSDLIIYALEKHEVGKAAGQALGLTVPGPRRQVPDTWAVEAGVYALLQAPAYLHFPGSAPALLQEVERLLGARSGPFLLLTATRAFFTPELDGALERAGCASLALRDVLAVGRGEFRLQTSIEPVLAEWAQRLAKGRGDGAMLVKIHQAIDAVRTEYQEMKTAKQRLEEMQKTGFLKFVTKIDERSLRVACATLMEGDVAKASRALGMPDTTVRALLRRWEEMGPAYGALLDLVRWRKRVGGKTVVPFNDALFHEKAAAVDAEGLLADVLDGA